ncbi:Beauvericin cluster-specific repressor BEA4 [Fusarium oxysporum f. sp. raphani]|uniref:Beauvericin cluster-specific repressor BEA4 n=1 Tax=Fusarium oxysporum f. sp. raphani TaxID=96318 RepID=A0A8J5PL46_FUSOX|nr:Beauvericin cluster-specific repressor BEA4 [Fusarium oxysporum f. sp. raphani]
MVGVPKSKGCLLCLQRSVKCDEERPSCAQCRRGGRACPGYVREMKFVDEGPKQMEGIMEIQFSIFEKEGLTGGWTSRAPSKLNATKYSLPSYQPCFRLDPPRRKSHSSAAGYGIFHLAWAAVQFWIMLLCQ